VFQCRVFGECTLLDCKQCPRHEARPGRAAREVDQIEVSAEGIGDHLMGLTVAAAWKQAHPDRELVFVVRHRQWAELFGGYDRLADAPLPGVPNPYPQLKDRGALHYVEAVCRVPGRALPPVKPLPEAAAAWAEQYRGHVVLCPLSLAPNASRDWHLVHWLAVERQLAARGVPCVAIGGGDQAGRLGAFRCPVVCGRPAADVAALMRAARAVVSNESGMAHLAGALGVPCVVLAAQLWGQEVHGMWPRTVVVQGPLHCSGCRWGGPHWRPACRDLCASLQAITPEMVVEALLPALGAAPAPLPGGAELLAHLGRLCVARPAPASGPALADRRNTVRAFLERLAAQASPLVVETGCQRADLDYGAGMSTTIFGLFLKAHGGRLVSLDSDPGHVEFARSRAAGLPVEVVPTDSRPWLRGYAGPPIDGLYLDSQDTYDPGFEACCLEEAQAALPHLAAGAVVLIDDTYQAGGAWHGKGALAVPWLLGRSWRLLASGYQALLAGPAVHP
jgi:hypothetical protein